jgi:mycoredoxin
VEFGVRVTTLAGVSDPSVIFYWRPGCGFCSRLERALAEANVKLDRRNIWEDDTSADFVRSVNRGNETVPTLVVGDQTLTNPHPADVLALLS